MAGVRLAGAVLGLLLLPSELVVAARARRQKKCQEAQDDGEDTVASALVQLVTNRLPLESPARPAAGQEPPAAASPASSSAAEGNSSEAAPGARAWLSQRALNQLSLDLFPVLLARMLQLDLDPRSGSYAGFDWTLSHLRVAEAKLRPPSLSFVKGTSLLFDCRGGFKIRGQYSVRGRSWYRFLRSEGTFSMSMKPGTEAAGFVFLGVSATGKPTAQLTELKLRLSPGDLEADGFLSRRMLSLVAESNLEADGFFSRRLLSLVAESNLEAEIGRVLESGVRAFWGIDVAEALSELDFMLPVDLAAPFDVLSYDFSLLGITLADNYLAMDLRGAPVNRQKPQLAYTQEPSKLPEAPPPGFESSMAALSTTSWATDGALWLLGQTGLPQSPTNRSQLPALLLEQAVGGFANGGSPLALALLGRQAVNSTPARTPSSPSVDADTGAAVLAADLRWDLSPFLAAKYGRKAAASFSAIASGLASGDF